MGGRMLGVALRTGITARGRISVRNPGLMYGYWYQ